MLHAPPVLSSGDATWLAPFVDGVILMVSWGETTEDQLLVAVSQLRMNHAPLIGTAINQVNPDIHRRHRYGGYVITSRRFPAGGWIRSRSRGNGAIADRPIKETNTSSVLSVRAAPNSPSKMV
ncbi:hypothetical protein SS05631_b59820 (plasmid) [Sinorhizobium sp. CCBAU 05631]|nr:hypothetical protein SS05631_b59820 [Sinorhizobium sp. CCBAU 05631]